MTNCKQCRQAITDNFCANCGHAAKIKRIDKHYLSHEILHLLHFEKGFPYTFRQLITRPGHSIREFITEDRSKHMKPVAYLILTSLLYTLVAHAFHADDFASNTQNDALSHSIYGKIQHWVQTNYGYANILMGGLIALCVSLFFRKYRYNLFEITVLLCFIMGEGMLILTLLTLFYGLLGKGAYAILLGVISLVYPTWAIGQFFDAKKPVSYVKAFFAYSLGYLSFQIVLLILAMAIDVISR